MNAPENQRPETFFNSLARRQKSLRSKLCIGLDPDLKLIPTRFKTSSYPIFDFNKAIIDATHDVAACFKPQIAHYSSEGAEEELLATIECMKELNIPVLLDAKRGDVGSTAEKYARELFERYGADAITVNPYLGGDSMQPYLDYKDKGVFILCRTSNPGGADLQNIILDGGETLYQYVARLAKERWNANNNVGLVVGATRPNEIKKVRKICAGMTFLLPGVGAQGAKIKEMMTAGQGGGILVSSSRAILYAGNEVDFPEKVRETAVKTRDEINSHSAEL